MKSIARHIIPLAMPFIIVFLLASSGLAGVLNIYAKKASGWRETSGVSNQDTSRNKQLTLHRSGISAQNVGLNDSVAIVGSFYVFRTLLEKDSKEHIIEVRSLCPSTFDSPPPSSILSWFKHSYSESVSPPFVEKYVLNATLLI